MPVRIRLGDNYYRYASLELLDKDMAAAEMRVQQIQRDLAKQQRDVERFRAGRVALAAEVAAAAEKTRARRKAERADKRLPKPETDEGEG